MERAALSVNVEDALEGTEEEEPIFGEPGADGGWWDRCRLTAMFDTGIDASTVIAEACRALDINLPVLRVAIVDDIDWVQKNREQFQPIRISGRIWIVPTWHRAPQPDAINIALDPGVAFGTGSHPTTRLCLQWLEARLVPAARSAVLDYGCGSGILAIAAMKLGAASAIGVDIDAQAVDAARYNARQNAVAIDFSTTDNPLQAVADITVANILANPLKVLAPLLASHTRAGGSLVLAGILDHQADEIIGIYHRWFELAVWKSDEGWSCMAGTRRGDA
jgi:ribosomal protein L11 methyltransferase